MTHIEWRQGSRRGSSYGFEQEGQVTADREVGSFELGDVILIVLVKKAQFMAKTLAYVAVSGVSLAQ